ncbi:MAG: hypothetical protein R2867_32425 [Caldilineaceae bacterium]
MNRALRFVESNYGDVCEIDLALALIRDLTKGQRAPQLSTRAGALKWRLFAGRRCFAGVGVSTLSLRVY